jgi:alkylation response protein AidB-like acyl-CoA dehydrogenase
MNSVQLDPHHRQHQRASVCDANRSAAPTGAQLLATIRRYAAEIDERAMEADAARAVPADLMDRLGDEGFFRMLLPRSLGGLELHPQQVIDIVEEASRADGSTGWTMLIAASPLFFAWLDPAVAASMIGTDGDVTASAMFAPMGRAVPDGNGGYVVDGRWSFNSSCVHADWHALGVMVMDGDAPRRRADGRPDWRFAFMRHESVELIETWDAGGLHATASHDLVATGVCVPEEHLAMPMFDAARHDGPRWRMSFWALLSFMGGFPLGVARRALDELAAMAATKSRGGPGPTLAEDAYVQRMYGQAEASVHAARALLRQAVTDVWETAVVGEAPDPECEAVLGLAMQQCMRAAVEAVDFAYTTAGGQAAYASHPLQRCFRDLHTATQHLAFRGEGYKSMAALRFDR